MKYDHIIWDWNGTLVNDAFLCVQIVNQILSERDLSTVDIRFYRENFCFPVNQYYRLLGLPYNGKAYQKVSQSFIEEYRLSQHVCNLHDSVPRILQTFQKQNLNQSILSAGNQHDVSNFLKHHKIFDYFNVISGVNHIYANGKKEISLNHLKKIKTNPDKVLFVGDTLHDSEIAEIMNVDCVLFSKGHNSSEKLKEANRKVIGNLEEILRLID